MNKIACIDLDGTLIHYDEWLGEEHFGEIITGASEALKKLKKNNWTIIIFTTRTNKKAISDFLKENNITFDYINENPYQPQNAIGGKPYADVYIDDRAIQFNGDWAKTIEEVEMFIPWEKRNIFQNDNTNENFLNADFEQSYQQLRHYDMLNWEITKFSFGELILSIGAIWAIYSYSNNPENINSLVSKNYNIISIIVLLIAYVFSLLSSFLLSRNRVYFSKVARYINEHRSLNLKKKPYGFENKTNFYTNINYPPAFDKWSTHLVSLYVIQVISSIIFSLIIYLILHSILDNKTVQYTLSIIGGIISFTVNIYIYTSYMKKQDIK